MSKSVRALLVSCAIVGLCWRSAAFQQNAAARPATPATDAAANSPDDAADSFVIEQLLTNVVFDADGMGYEERSARIRIQSDAALKAFGVLAFPYRGAFDRLETIEIRVKKPDGTIVITPDSEAQDMPTQATREAPTYSDTREKQVPVKGLGVGDVLEWRSRTAHTAADIPGQFWYTHEFLTTGTVLDETLRITVPAAKYVKVASPSLAPKITEENGQKIYTWSRSYRQPAETNSKKITPIRQKPPSVQISTFKNWEEVGRWYGMLQASKVQVTPVVQAKASELIRGLTTNAEKERAIYRYVATRFRYISVSFGQGRYQPHSADEVLANEYGDCKDKHTLFAALLKAAGIDAWPALIGAGIELDRDVPSPAQFNHVITFIPGDPSALWLDTTPEVAPFGMLMSVLRDTSALVIPASGAPSLVMTPAALPFSADETVDVKAKLDGEGTLTGHFDITTRGDGEVVFKSIFHETAPSQWGQLAQNISQAMGYAGTVTGVSVDNPTNTEAPFHYSYNYERKEYSDWADRQFTPPIPPISFEYSGEEEAPKESIAFGAPGTLTYRATLELPVGYSVTLPGVADVRTDFADYHASYQVEGETLTVIRTLTRNVLKLSPDHWTAYKDFVKSVLNDENQFIVLTTSGSPHVSRNDVDAANLIQKAAQAMRQRQLNSALDALKQAERINPQQPGLHAAYAMYYGVQNRIPDAIDSMEKEIDLNPGNPVFYRMLAAMQKRAGRHEDEIETYRDWAKNVPGDKEALQGLSSVLISAKRYDEAAEPLQNALKASPDDASLQALMLEVFARSGKKAEAAAIVAKLKTATLNSTDGNSVAWTLADTNTEPAVAQEIAERAVADLEQRTGKVSLTALATTDLRDVFDLGATWDTLGWAYFRTGDLVKAERFLNAAWILIQHPAAVDHLGQLYEKQGKKTEAIRLYRLALAAKSDLPETRLRLENLGVKADERPTLTRGGATPAGTAAAEELSRMRSSPVPQLPQRDGNAEFFLLFSPKGVVDVRFINGDEKLRSAAGILPKSTYKIAFPDDGPEKIARRGTLSCSGYTTPSCNFVLLLPENTQK